MAQFKPIMVANKASLANVAEVVGQYIVVIDSNELYLDTKDGRVKVSQNVYIQNTQPTGAKAGDVWIQIGE